MSAVDLSLFPDDFETEAAVLGERPKECFWCGQPLPAGPVVVWHGVDEQPVHQIGLHPKCAIRFAARLCKDASDASHHKTIEKALPSAAERTPGQEVKAIIEPIGALLAGHSAELQGAALADLVATWLAGHFVTGNLKATQRLRSTLLARFRTLVRQLTAINAKIIGTPS